MFRAADPEALIEEARQRRRRRRIRAALGLLALAAVAAAAYGIDRVVGGSPGAGARGPQPVVNLRAFAGHGRLAFVSRGQLYVLDGATRKLVAVTRPHAGASDPSFSPDGRRLLYRVGQRTGVARADGSDQHLHRGGGSWLPDGRLVLGRRIVRVTADGALVPDGPAPAGLVAWAPDGSRYAFFTSHLVRRTDGTMRGVERLELADSLRGRRTLWYRIPQRFTPRGGFSTPNLGGVVVLPARRGVLFWLDPFHSSSLAADGLPLYELTGPSARPRRLGVTVGAKVSVGAGTRLAVGAGQNRYAWLSKTAETCSLATSRCSPVPAPAGRLTLDPAWSPDGRTLAFVAAAPGRASDFFQPTIRRWYATHSLWLLPAGAARAVEVPGTRGAAAPVWARDGKAILYVANDGLWLLPSLDAKPVEVASPLFPTSNLPSYYGEIDWTAQFAWSSP